MSPRAALEICVLSSVLPCRSEYMFCLLPQKDYWLSLIIMKI
jgi:hypothetical protein